MLCGKTLGKGSFGRVELAIHCITNTKVALKIIDFNDISEEYIRKNLLRESSILKSLRHPNIVRLYEALAHHQTYCFVTEYLEGGDLYTYMQRQRDKKFSEKQSRLYFVQLLHAVQYLHSKGIIHRDLKLQNILLTKTLKTIKIVDFGLSNYCGKHDLLKTRCGSALYAAPEFFEKEVSYGPSVEIWSLGVILFVMTTGEMPFWYQANDTRDNFVARLRKGMSIEHEHILKRISPDLKRLLVQVLEPDVAKRLPLEGIISDLWVTDRSRSPLLPLPAEVIPHEIRQKIIERVAELYCRPVPDTIKTLQVEHQDVMHATFEILLHKSLWYQRSTSNHSNNTAKLTDQKRNRGKTSATSTRSSARSTPLLPQEQNALEDRPQNMNIVRISKYKMMKSHHKDVRPPNNSPKKSEYRVPSLDKRTGTRTSSVGNDDQFLSSEELKLLDYDYDAEVDVTLSDFDLESQFLYNDPHPVNSCLKVSKKSCGTFKDKQFKTSPCSTRSPSPDEELRQTPFRLDSGKTSFTGQQNSRTKEKSYSTKKSTKRGSKTVKSTLEGAFDLNKSENSSDEETEGSSNRRFLIESDQIRVTISGNKLAKGTFKITHESSGRSTLQKQCQGEKRSSKASEDKPCLQCLSPYQARQMLHRHTFPLKSTSMRPRTRHKPVVITQQPVTSPLSKYFTQKQRKEPVKGFSRAHENEAYKRAQAKYMASEREEYIPPTNIISTPDSFLRMQQQQQPFSKKPLSRCSMQKARQILALESIKNKQDHRQGDIKINKDGRMKPPRRVSFSI